MALTFPRALPTGAALAVAPQSFALRRVDYLSPVVGGGGGSVTAGWPVWTGEWAFTAYTEEKAQEWLAWLDSLRGPQRLFYGQDLARVKPLAGLAGSGAATSWSLNNERDVLTLTGLSAGQKITTGDMIGFTWGTGSNRRAPVRALESATVPSGGGPVAVTVEPAVPKVVAGTATASLDGHTALMRLAAEPEIEPANSRHILRGRFSAVQVLLA